MGWMLKEHSLENDYAKHYVHVSLNEKQVVGSGGGGSGDGGGGGGGRMVGVNVCIYRVVQYSL